MKKKRIREKEKQHAQQHTSPNEMKKKRKKNMYNEHEDRGETQ